LCGLDLWSFEQEEYQLMPLGRSKWGVQHEGQWKAP
jgi:hypothetical protein